MTILILLYCSRYIADLVRQHYFGGLFPYMYMYMYNTCIYMQQFTLYVHPFACTVHVLYIYMTLYMYIHVKVFVRICKHVYIHSKLGLLNLQWRDKVIPQMRTCTEYHVLVDALPYVIVITYICKARKSTRYRWRSRSCILRCSSI